MSLSNEEREAVVAYRTLCSTGELTVEQGRLAKLLFANRREGDYEDFVEMSKEDIEPLMPKVKALIRKLKELTNNDSENKTINILTTKKQAL